MHNNTMVKTRVRIKNNSTIGIVMSLLTKNNSDAARFKMTQCNNKFKHITLSDNNFSIYSSVGDWLSMFSRYLKFESNVVKKCDTCGKILKQSHRANSINIDIFNAGYEALVP